MDGPAPEMKALSAPSFGLTHDVPTVFNQTETVRLVQTVTGCHIKVFQLAGGQGCPWLELRAPDCKPHRDGRWSWAAPHAPFGGQLEIRNEYHEVDRAVNRHTNVMHMAVFEQRHTEAAEDRRCGVIRMAPRW